MRWPGERCERILDEKIRNVTVDQVQADEIWSFVHCKQKNIRRGQDDRAIGDQYTWVALDPKSKLVISYIVGKRSGLNALALMTDLCGRLANRTQLTTDGFAPYVGAVEEVFGADIDFAQLIKIYANPTEERRVRYSPSECVGAVPTSVTGNPDPEMICTSHVERANLTMRTFIRRMTRLCLGFSKKLDNLKSAVALYFAWYNFVRSSWEPESHSRHGSRNHGSRLVAERIDLLGFKKVVLAWVLGWDDFVYFLDPVMKRNNFAIIAVICVH